MKLTKRKGFNFFRSYYDVFNELNNEDKLQFIEALLDRQFQGIKPTNLTGMAKFAYISQTNNIDSQVKGYEDKTGVKLTPCQAPSVGGKNTPSLQVEVKEKVKEEVKPPTAKIEFETFWTLYDKKQDTAKCKKKWDSLKTETQIIILDHVPKYVKSTLDKQYRKNPLTYLNGQCWMDEIEVVDPRAHLIDLPSDFFTIL